MPETPSNDNPPQWPSLGAGAAKRVWSLRREPVVPLHRVDLVYHVEVWNDDEDHFEVSSTLGDIELRNGTLYVSGEAIVTPQFEHTGLTWSQKTADHYTSGMLQFRPDARGFSGTVFVGTTEQDAVPFQVVGTTPPSEYTSLVAATGTADGSLAPDGQKVRGPKVTLGFEPSPQGGMPVSILRIDGQDVTSFSQMKVNSHHLLVATINYDRDMASGGYGATSDPQWPAAGEFTFSWDARGFQGQMQKWDPATNDKTPLKYAWDGTLVEAPAPHAMAAARAAAPRTMAVSGLSLAELWSISPDGVQQASFDLLVRNMKWAIRDDWRENFFGETKPLLTTESQALINQRGGPEFYREQFAPAYLGWGFSHMTGPGAPKNNLSTEEKLKLKYFMYKGLPETDGYNTQSHGLFVEAFIQRAPRLQDYIDDGGESWARQLFASITTPQQINMTINDCIADRNMNVPNRFSTILTALAPKSGLAKKYNTIIVTALMPRIAPDVKLDDPNQTEPWLTDIIRAFVAQYLTKPTNPTEAEARRHEMASALDKAIQVMGGVGRVGREFANLLAASQGGSIYERSQQASDAFAKKYPNLARAGRFLLVGAWAGGLFSAIIGFQKWDKLNAAQKASLILSTVQLFGNLILAVPEIISGARASLKTLIGIRKFFTRIQPLGELTLSMEAIDPDWMRNGAKRTGEFFDAGRKVIKTEGTFFGKMFRGLRVIVAWLGAAVAAAFAVISTIEFVHELHGDASTRQKAFSGIIMCAALAETVCLVAAMFVAAAVFAAAAAVFAVIGLVFALVMLFDPPPPPESPIDRFMRETVHPFVSNLPDPPADWQPLTPPSSLVAH
jgi:hypothetical protein